LGNTTLIIATSDIFLSAKQFWLISISEIKNELAKYFISTMIFPLTAVKKSAFVFNSSALAAFFPPVCPEDKAACRGASFFLSTGSPQFSSLCLRSRAGLK
jgi:hypothetical protein